MSGIQESNTDLSDAQIVKAQSGTKRRKPRRRGEGKIPVPLTYDLVRELFDYDPSGWLRWKESPRYGIEAGEVAGNYDPHRGYYVLMVYGESYLLHRVIFLWHHGYMPEGITDHEDRCRVNNKIDNLRDISRTCNNRNCVVRSDSKTGVCGVFWHSQSRKWEAKIRVNTVGYTLGRYDECDFDLAVMARHAAEIHYNWKGCNSTSSAYLYLKGKGLI